MLKSACFLARARDNALHEMERRAAYQQYELNAWLEAVTMRSFPLLSVPQPYGKEVSKVLFSRDSSPCKQ